MYRTDTVYFHERPTATPRFRYLHAYETIREGDIVEDMQAGDRAPITPASFYGFLIGKRVDQAKELPAVVDVLRPAMRLSK